MKKLLPIFLATLVGLIVGYSLSNYQQERSSLIPAGLDCEKSNPDDFFMVSNNDDRTLDLLRNELSKANQELDQLKGLNDALSTQIARLNLPIASMTYPELIDKIDQLPDSFISDKLAYFIDKDAIADIEDVRAFSKRLIDVALAEGEDSGQTGSAVITFSTSPVFGNQLISQSASVHKFDTIFAHIESSGRLDQAIVKWQELNSGEILLFKNHSLDPENPSKYIFLRPRSGWKSGSYRVSLHTMDDQVNPISGNSYSIATVVGEDSDSSSANNNVIQELIATGQAVPKQ